MRAVKGTDRQYQVDVNPLPGRTRVFRAVRATDGRRVLVKRPRPGFPVAEEAAALRHELFVLSLLKGAPVARALELIEDPAAGLVLEVAPGRSLDVFIADSRPDVARFVSCGLAMARTLAAVHARGVTHRDVKPHHFFFEDGAPEACLVDFGLATHLSRERQSSSELEQIPGTLAYISPEQTGRTSQSIDHRSDLYSLGVTLYELWTGRLPFEGEDALGLIHAHIARKPTPPGHLRPELPGPLEAMILKLLAKAPEERYQTALGLVADLERARAELSATGTIAPFDLGQHDFDGTLRIPEKLYGRGAPRAALLEQVRDAQSGARALALVVGAPGVGKSALVLEVHREIVRGGHFVSGKFDQYGRGVPYSALAAACSELVRVYLASTASELEAWRGRLRQALGSNAKVVMDVVPLLAVALGEQPDVPELPPSEAQARFERTFRRFMEASACREAPLVLFLDDLQWADTASLSVLELILTSESQGHLLVIGSYRDSEVDATHAVTHLVERVGRRARVQRILLEALTLADVRELVSDALRLTQHDVESLAALVHQKTSGNPFFIGQFLERLAAEGLLRFEAGKGYSWELSEIAALGATDNVVDLVVARLGALDPRTRHLLQLAACIGHTFRLRTLALIAEDEPRAVMRGLLPAVQGGYLVPIGGNHRLLDDLLDTSNAAGVDASYRFAHDRVQQAALSTSDARARARVHLRVGRLLLAAAGEQGPSDEQLFEILTQLNLGRQLVEDAEERLRIARLDLRGAKRARAAAAHATAAQLAAVAVELLGEQPFAADHQVSLEAHFIGAQSHYLLHDEARASSLLATIEAHASNPLEQVPARNLRATIVTNQGRPREATSICVETLAMLGVRLPDIGDDAALGAAIGEAFGAYQAALGARDVAGLYDLPPMTDPHELALVATFACAIPPVFQWNPSLMVLLVLRAVRLPLEHGTAAMSPFFYAQYGIVHHVVTGDPERAHAFGKLALALSARPEYAVSRGGVEFIYAEFLAPWVRPRSECALHFEQGVVAGLDTGDQLHAAFCLAVGMAEALYAGERLVELERRIPAALRTLMEQGDVLNHLLVELVSRGLAALRGETETLGSMDGPGFAESQFEAGGPPPVKAHYGATKAMLRFLFGDYDEARRITEVMQPPPGVSFKVEYVFYHGMACVELSRRASPEEERALLALAEADLACFAPWVSAGSGNFSALAALLEAELRAARGEREAALGAFERALDLAAEAGAAHHLALGHERAGRFHLRSGRKQLARLSFEAALEQYELWGATGKVQALRRELPELRGGGGRHDALRSTGKSTSSSSDGGRLDLQSAMRAVAAIGSEIRLEPLLRRLTHILVENAGATRGVLLLAEQGDFVVRASLDVQSEQVRTEADAERDARGLAWSAVRYCARTRECLVVDSLARDARFAHEPLARAKEALSLSCVPLVHQTHLLGVLYLENDAVAGAFHAARIERLEFLAGHAAVALQNAKLYEELQAANESLERRVNERTRELSERNQDMRRVLDNVRQGLLTLDLEGRLLPEHSRVVDEWLGGFAPRTPFTSYVAGIDARFAARFRPAFNQLLEGVLPEEVLLDQLPTELTHRGRELRVSYQPIHGGGALSGLLLVIDDVTAAVRRAREEAEQKDALSLCHHLSRDRGALLSFFDEGQSLVQDLAQSSKLTPALRRSLHTLKGNAGLYGFATLVESCHAAEDAIAEGTLHARHLEAVTERFGALRRTLTSIAGDNAGDRVEISRATLREVAERLAAGVSPARVSADVERLLLEPAATALERLAKYARALAIRLGKVEPRVEVKAEGVFVDGKSAAPLVAALVHLVRNAVDHGLGSEEPTLSLSASLTNGELVITVHDNGRGVDWERIRQRALSRGLPAGSMNELREALFSAEISTRDEASTISGRGVGLAALAAEVRRLSGRVSVDSGPGAGALFRVSVPAAALRARAA